MKKISVIGDGGWGTALSILMQSKGLDVVLWSVSSDYAEFLREKRENTKFLEGITLPEGLKITSKVEDVDGSDFVFFVVPCEYLREVAEKFSSCSFGTIISATKGIENTSLKRASEILSEFYDE